MFTPSLIPRSSPAATSPAGNALVVDPSMPYAPLSKFGNKFLNRFQCSKTRSSVLENLTLIDTPGILSGETQSIDRGYDFKEVIRRSIKYSKREKFIKNCKCNLVLIQLAGSLSEQRGSENQSVSSLSRTMCHPTAKIFLATNGD